MVEVECDRVDQVAEAVDAGRLGRAPRQHGPGRGGARASALVRARAVPGPVLVEVSGGVTLETAGPLAAAGADLMSVGALTHSAPALDLGLDLVAGDRARRRRSGAPASGRPEEG